MVILHRVNQKIRVFSYFISILPQFSLSFLLVFIWGLVYKTPFAFLHLFGKNLFLLKI
jgi:hypothetical protein